MLQIDVEGLALFFYSNIQKERAAAAAPIINLKSYTMKNTLQRYTL